jgi:gamma-glutamyltranspeptidase/glutathione hydrolase/leukotriene-C4 hydrolase
MMTVYDSKTGKTSCLDARERTLVSAGREGRNMTSPKESNVTVVPGQLSGYWIAHQRYGRLPWYRLVLPSAFLADDELIVSGNLAKVLKDKSEFIEQERSMRFLRNPHLF